MQIQSTYLLEKVLKAMQLSGVNSDTTGLHRVYDNLLQRAEKCIDVQGDHLQHLL
jgi:hypothetical protein